MSKFYDEIEIDFIILLLPSYFSVLYIGIYVWQNCIHMYNHRMHSTICWLHGYQPALPATSANEQSVPSESYMQEVKEHLKKDIRRTPEEDQEYFCGLR